MSYTRNLKVIYQIVLNNFDTKNAEDAFIFGICNIIRYLYNRRLISIREYNMVMAHFKAHKPTIFSKFWWHRSYRRRKSAFWWNSSKAGDGQRKKFLQHLINNL